MANTPKSRQTSPVGISHLAGGGMTNAVRQSFINMETIPPPGNIQPPPGYWGPGWDQSASTPAPTPAPVTSPAPAAPRNLPGKTQIDMGIDAGINAGPAPIPLTQPPPPPQQQQQQMPQFQGNNSGLYNIGSVGPSFGFQPQYGFQQQQYDPYSSYSMASPYSGNAYSPYSMGNSGGWNGGYNTGAGSFGPSLYNTGSVGPSFGTLLGQSNPWSSAGQQYGNNWNTQGPESWNSPQSQPAAAAMPQQTSNSYGPKNGGF